MSNSKPPESQDDINISTGNLPSQQSKQPFQHIATRTVLEWGKTHGSSQSPVYASNARFTTLQIICTCNNLSCLMKESWLHKLHRHNRSLGLTPPGSWSPSCSNSFIHSPGPMRLTITPLPPSFLSDSDWNDLKKWIVKARPAFANLWKDTHLIPRLLRFNSISYIVSSNVRWSMQVFSHHIRGESPFRSAVAAIGTNSVLTKSCMAWAERCRESFLGTLMDWLLDYPSETEAPGFLCKTSRAHPAWTCGATHCRMETPDTSCIAASTKFAQAI